MSHPNGQSAGKPFTEKDVAQIIKLEQLFHAKYLTDDLLHELIALYVKAIDIFGSNFTFMRTYFLEKMSFVLSRPQIIKLLEGGGQNGVFGDIRETLRVTERARQQFQVSAKNQEQQQRKFGDQKKVVQEHHHHYHYDQNKGKQRDMRINMKMQVMREVQENMKNVKKQVNEADERIQKNEEKVKNITKGQEDILAQRLAKRKKRLRKKSVQIKAKKPEGEDDQEPVPVVKKEQLIEAQRQLTQAVIKFTIRMTQKQEAKEEPKKKGRVKIQELSDEEQAPPVNMKKNKKVEQNERKPTGRVKTKKLMDEDDQYW